MALWTEAEAHRILGAPVPADLQRYEVSGQLYVDAAHAIAAAHGPRPPRAQVLAAVKAVAAGATTSAEVAKALGRNEGHTRRILLQACQEGFVQSDASPYNRCQRVWSLAPAAAVLLPVA